MITDFEHAMRLNRLVQQYWFTPDTMQLFRTSLGGFAPAPYGAYFAYTHGLVELRHRVAYINDAGYVNPSYAGEGSGHLSRKEFEHLFTHQYDSLDEASQAAREMARKAWGRR